MITDSALSIAHFGSTEWWLSKDRKKDSQIARDRFSLHLKIMDKIYVAPSRAI